MGSSKLQPVGPAENFPLKFGTFFILNYTPNWPIWLVVLDRRNQPDSKLVNKRKESLIQIISRDYNNNNTNVFISSDGNFLVNGDKIVSEIN